MEHNVQNRPPPVVPPLGSTLIPVVNKLRQLLEKVNMDSRLELPFVAFVGSQSSGKSSVLEALVGRDFLPKASDTCTRRPMLLQLVRTDEQSVEYGEFHHLPGRKFYDFSDIREQIQVETEREVGRNKNVSNKEICLKIYSNRFNDMTLVDLPGMTNVPDNETQIRNMILSYIKQPHCVIVAITPADSDITESDALHIAGIADPDCKRTIAVLTKLDMVFRDTNACKLLLGRKILLQNGYIGVVNRCQEDIEINKEIEDALASEEAFFRSHPVYNSVADSCGIPQLAKKLNKMFVRHIVKMLPALKSSIQSKLVLTAKEHSSYRHLQQERDPGSLVLEILLNYSKAFVSLVDGRNEGIITSELYGGARIHYIFQSIFVSRLEEVDPFERLTNEEIRTAIHNATGPSSALFVPEAPFQVLVRRQIARLLDPSLRCARLAYNELVKMSRSCLVHELERFPLLKEGINETVGNFLVEALEPAQTMIVDIVEMETDFINTSHPKFIGGNKALELASNQLRTHKLASPRTRDGVDSDAVSVSGSNRISNAIVARSQANGIVSDQGVRSVADIETNGSYGAERGSNWRISSIFRGREVHDPAINVFGSNSNHAVLNNREHASSIIHLREPPLTLNSSEMHSEHDTMALAVTRLLLDSYYTIVRKNIQDSVPKAIMHFLVNRAKREIRNVLIKNLYRESLFQKLLQETEEVSLKRKHVEETRIALQEALQLLDDLQNEAATVQRGLLGGS